MRMDPPGDSLTNTAGRLRAAADALDTVRQEPSVDGLLGVLHDAGGVRSTSDSVIVATVGMLRNLDVSWVEIAAALGTTRQAAWDRYRAAEADLEPPDAELAARASSGRPQEPSELEPGKVYTRVELQRLFAIRDATIKNGVFLCKPRAEIWLFVTEEKQPDRVQFEDQLVGDELRWQGQLSGRTDRLVTNHRADGNRILVFYRRNKTQYAGAGFRLEGEFEYVSSTPGSPTAFVFKRAS
jgi:hypothetical protein